MGIDEPIVVSAITDRKSSHATRSMTRCDVPNSSTSLSLSSLSSSTSSLAPSPATGKTANNDVTLPSSSSIPTINTSPSSTNAPRVSGANPSREQPSADDPSLSISLSVSEIDITSSVFDLSSPRDLSLNVLVVEDNVFNQTVMKTMLEMCGHKVDIANNGVEGVDKFLLSNNDTNNNRDDGRTVCKHPPYDFILMDCFMPEKDGFTAAAEMRLFEKREVKIYAGSLASLAYDSRCSLSELNCIPIVAFTASTAKTDFEKCVNSGMDRVMTKPVKFDDLQRVIERYKLRCYRRKQIRHAESNVQ